MGSSSGSAADARAAVPRRRAGIVRALAAACIGASLVALVPRPATAEPAPAATPKPAPAATPPPAAANPAANPAAASPAPANPAGGAPSPTREAPAGDLSSLLAGMRSATGVVAKFTETKELELLSAPLQAAGTIYFLPPGRLVRDVTSPGRSRLVVDGDRVRFEDETGSKAMDLSGSPIARQLIDSFVVLFNGDEKRLNELYEATFSATGDTWKLHLVPRSMPLNRMIAAFDLAGTGARIDRMEAVEPDGDRTVTVFGDTEVHHRFDDAELERLFGARPGS